MRPAQPGLFNEGLWTSTTDDDIDPLVAAVGRRQAPEFKGVTIDAALDTPRLSRALEAVALFAADGCWHTLAEIAEAVGCSEAGASARLRDLRKARFGGKQVERMRVAGGLWAYRIAGKTR